MEDLTAIVKSTLETRGALGKIRAELRANVFCAIHEQNMVSAPRSDALTSLQDGCGALALQVRHSVCTTTMFSLPLLVLF